MRPWAKGSRKDRKGMFFREDNTYRDLLEKSVQQWLSQMKDHEDVTVRGGVKATEEYIESLRQQITFLKEQNGLKDQYLKKMKRSQTDRS